MIINKFTQIAQYTQRADNKEACGKKLLHNLEQGTFEFSKNSISKRDLINFKGPREVNKLINELHDLDEDEGNNYRENAVNELSKVKKSEDQELIFEKLTKKNMGINHTFLPIVGASVTVLGRIGADAEESLKDKIKTTFNTQLSNVNNSYTFLKGEIREALNKLQGEKK